MTQTISIHRALTLIKKSENVINEKLSNGKFVSTIQGLTKRPLDRSFKNEQELLTNIQSDTDTVESNLKLISTLKTKIAQKNLETLVDFNGSKVSITELLAIKSTLSLQKKYVRVLKSQQSTAQNEVERQEQAIVSQLSNVDATQKEEVYKQLQDTLGVSIVTGSSKTITETVKNLQERIDFLENEIDITLSEINLSTMIEY